MIHDTCYIRRLAAETLTLFVIVIALIVLFAAPSAQAQDYIPLAPITGEGIAPADQFTRCDPMPKYGAAGELTNEADLCLPKYLRTLYNMGVALAGLFLVFSIVRGGFTLMFTDSVLNRMEGKKIILQAMGGAVIVFSSYLFLNMINPELGERLNLSLKFPSITIQKFASKLEAVKWTDVQLAEVRQSTKDRQAALQAQRKKLEDNAALLRASAMLLPDDDFNKTLMLEAAAQTEQEAAKLYFTETAVLGERLASLETANASSPENLQKAIAEADTAVKNIEAASDRLSTAFASDPKTVASLKVEEMQRISTIEKMTAYGILNSPPSYDPTGQYYNTQVGQQINKIINQRDAKKSELMTLVSQNQGILEVIDFANAKISDVERIAKIEICAIKNECAVKLLGCDRLDIYRQFCTPTGVQ